MRGLLFLLVLVPALAGGVGGAATRLQAADVPLLLIASDRGGTGGLYAVSLDGRAIQPISHGREAQLDSVSPDGGQVAFLEDGIGFLARSDGTRRRRLPGVDLVEGAWSPDGSLFGYATGIFDGRLLVVGRDGRRRMVYHEANSGPMWLPDGRSFLLTTEGHARVRRVGVDGRGARTLLEAAGADVADAVWSPDGTKVAYAKAEQDDAADLYVAAADGSQPARIVRDAGEPAWSPDGNRIVFVRDVGDGSELWTVAAGGGGARRLTRGGSDRRPSWSPDGRSIVFDRSDSEDESALMSVGVDGGGRLAGLGREVNALDPDWLPDGSGFVATVRRGQNTSIGLFAASGRFVRLLTPPRSDAAPAVSPDGRQIAFARGAAVAVMSLDGSGARVIAASPEDASAPRWRADGVAFTAVSPGELALVDVRDGSRRTIARDLDSLFASAALSPQGALVAYDGVDDLSVRDLEGRLLAVVAADVGSLQWSPDGKSVAFDTFSGPLGVLRLNDRTVRRVDIRFNDNWGWHPGGRHLVRARRDRLDLVDVRTAAARPLVPRHPGRRQRLPIWSPDQRSFAYDRERFPGLGSDVYIAAARGGPGRRVTTPFPDGGSNGVVAWLRAPRPILARRPHVRRVVAVPVARSRSIHDLRSSGDGALYVSGRPGGVCGRIHLVPSGSSLNPCRGGSPLVGAGATAGTVAWVLFHADEGAGDEEGACLFVRSFGAVFPRPQWTRSCDPFGAGGEHVASAFDGEMRPLESAPNLIVVGRSGWDEEKEEPSEEILRIDGKTVTPIVRSRGSLKLLGVDAFRVVALRGRGAIAVYRSDGALLRTLQFAPGSVVDAALDGPRLVVLRPNAIEQYDLARRARLARVPIRRGLGPLPRLAGATDGTAAYIEGAVIHLVRFSDRRDTGLWFRELAPPIHAALTARGLYVGYHRENVERPGIVGLVPLTRVVRK